MVFKLASGLGQARIDHDRAMCTGAQTNELIDIAHTPENLLDQSTFLNG